MNRALLSAALLAAAACTSSAQVLGSDDFDTPMNLTTFTAVPDLSGNAGFFPTNNQSDVFGILSRSDAESRNGFDLLDDSLMGSDTFGIINSTKLDNVFAVGDIRNTDNPGGTGTVEWVFDVSPSPFFGTTNDAIFLVIEVAAIGNFDASSDPTFEFTVELQESGGGTILGPTTVLDIDVNEATSQFYVLEGGDTSIADPLDVVVGPDVNPDASDPSLLDNVFRELQIEIPATTGQIEQTGRVVVRFAAEQDGGAEYFMFDNIRVAEGIAANDPSVLPTGACCDSIVCSDNQTVLTCGSVSDFFEGQTCGADNAPCDPIPNGACCDGETTCTDDVAFNDCQSPGQRFFADVMCSSDPCQLLACCQGAVTCTEVADVAACDALSGTFFADVDECPSDPTDLCEPGACCTGPDTCIDGSNELECNGLAGAFNVGVSCPPPGSEEDLCSIQGCCTFAGFCVDTNPSECATVFGGLSIAGQTCPPNAIDLCVPAACCTGPDSCVLQSRVECDDDGGTFFEGQSCPVNASDLCSTMMGPSGCVGDTNDDLMADATDFLAVLVAFGSTAIDSNYNAGADFDNDDDVDADDFLAMLVAFGREYDPSNPVCTPL
ncbi:MAG: hypothetical protein AAGI30_01505 [Planctomycetota bacterium]